MPVRAARGLLVGVALMAAVTRAAPAATAAWGAGGSGVAQAKAGTMVKPAITSVTAGQCPSRPNRHITLTVTGLALPTGRFEVARSDNSGEQSFASPLAVGGFSGSGFSYKDSGDSIVVDTTYHYVVRVLPPEGGWVSVASDEVSAACSS